MKHTCHYCKTEFDAPRKDKNYCDASCRQQAYMLRKGTIMAGLETSDHKNTISENDVSENSIDEHPDLEVEKISSIEKKYLSTPGKFVSRISDLLEERNYAYQLSGLARENPSIEKSMNWINVRLRCLVECMLTLSERKTVLLNDLIEITNAFTLLIISSHYKALPDAYPYTDKLKELRNKLKSICIAAESMEKFQLKLAKTLKIELIVIRCELRAVAPKRTYNQLEFKENKNQKSCETNHHQTEKPELKQWQINLQNLKNEKDKY